MYPWMCPSPPAVTLALMDDVFAVNIDWTWLPNISCRENLCCLSLLWRVSREEGRYDEGDGKEVRMKRGRREGRRVARITSDHSSELVPPPAPLFLPSFFLPLLHPLPKGSKISPSIQFHAVFLWFFCILIHFLLVFLWLLFIDHCLLSVAGEMKRMKKRVEREREREREEWRDRRRKKTTVCLSCQENFKSQTRNPGTSWASLGSNPKRLSISNSLVKRQEIEVVYLCVTQPAKDSFSDSQSEEEEILRETPSDIFIRFSFFFLREKRKGKWCVNCLLRWLSSFLGNKTVLFNDE